MSNYFQVFNSHVSGSVGVADAATEDIWNNIKTGLLKTTEVCGTARPNHWRCETWWWNEHVGKAIAANCRGKISRPGRLVKALGHRTMQPNAFPDMHCTMLVKKPTRRPTRILTPSLQKSTALLTSLEERILLLVVADR